jgi:hypothetical protein
LEDARLISSGSGSFTFQAEATVAALAEIRWVFDTTVLDLDSSLSGLVDSTVEDEEDEDDEVAVETERPS